MGRKIAPGEKKGKSSVRNKDTQVQVNKYDKIWRENLQAVLPGLIEKVLKLHIVHSETLSDKVQVTQQRETDSMSKVTDVDGDTYILHIEVQTESDPRMPLRMAEYRIMASIAHGLPVRQYVIYLGERDPTMTTSISEPHFYFEYTLISLSDLPYHMFLSSDKPEEKILAVLADFEGEKPEKVIRTVLKEVREASSVGLYENKYLQQLRVIIQLRNFSKQFKKAMETVTKFFKEEKDPFFVKGERKGDQRKTEKVIRNLIRISHLTDEQIAEAAEVSVDYVALIRAEASAENRTLR